MNKIIKELSEEWGKDYPKLPKSMLPYTDSDIEAVASNSYVQGATDQGYIDINKACEWLSSNWRKYIDTDGDGMIRFAGWKNDFIKAMTDEIPTE